MDDIQGVVFVDRAEAMNHCGLVPYSVITDHRISFRDMGVYMILSVIVPISDGWKDTSEAEEYAGMTREDFDSGLLSLERCGHIKRGTGEHHLHYRLTPNGSYVSPFLIAASNRNLTPTAKVLFFWMLSSLGDDPRNLSVSQRRMSEILSIQQATISRALKVLKLEGYLKMERIPGIRGITYNVWRG